MNIKLKKKKKDFLLVWLSDDLEIDKTPKSKPIIKVLKSIIKKLQKGK